MAKNRPSPIRFLPFFELSAFFAVNRIVARFFFAIFAASALK
jgi:hypothetical protein